MPLPDFVVIGAQKAGTTSLYRMLRKHPQVHMPRTKELHYFDFHYERGPEWYAAQFRPGRWERRRGEATPNYMWGPLARQRLIADLPSARIIAILRNPVDRAYSHYWHDRRRREMERHDRAVQPTFEQALARERPVTFRSLVEACRRRAAGPRPAVARQLRPARGVRRPAGAVPRRRTAGIASTWCSSTTWSPTGRARLRELFGFLRVLKRPARTIEDAHANRYRRRGRVRAGADQRRTSPIDPATREVLAEHYRPHNERWVTLLGRDLSHWR